MFNGASDVAASGANSVMSAFKINLGPKESSTSGLTMNSIVSGAYTLDKTGAPCRRWVKKPTTFKTFSGFKMRIVSYKPRVERKKKIKAEE